MPTHPPAPAQSTLPKPLRHAAGGLCPLRKAEAPATLDSVLLCPSQAVCEWLGASWESIPGQSFDNVLYALNALLQISTTEGWVDSMYLCVDSRGDPLRFSTELSRMRGSCRPMSPVAAILPY